MTKRDDLENTMEEFGDKLDSFDGEQSDYDKAEADYNAADAEYNSTVDDIETKAKNDPEYTQSEYDADTELLNAADEKHQGAWDEYKAASDDYKADYDKYKSDYATYANAAHELLRIDMAALAQAIPVVALETVMVSVEMAKIQNTLNSVGDAWQGPAFQSYEAVQQWFQRTQKSLEELLMEILRRMRASQANYKDAEEKNFQNVTPDGGDPLPGDDNESMRRTAGNAEWAIRIAGAGQGGSS
ncbi:WXG100 family type VII secretion target [Streptomyces tsukubensis]|uniref:Uncharacterized protein n=1 Tax=Streptomyces tsukubensis TaxID=83656 RepID=A0A1V4A660_9ACTN|nr:WXG100 family type VII secretion target [Streptomyces tsukubensis]OON77026.1 hypothetical protein B1H18_20040 [Streptomyces tsukubensis]